MSGPLNNNMDRFLKAKERLKSNVKKIRIIIDLFLYLFVLGLLLTSYLGAVAPSNAFIKCNDPSISHKLGKDTISVSLLLCVCLLFPFIKIGLVETIKGDGSIARPSTVKPGLKKSCDHVCTILVGGLFAFFIVEILKTCVSEPRPHFMSSCQPNLTDVQCSSNTWIHVTWEDCQNPHNLSHRKILDTMKSFPSGHACLGIFTAVFMSAYTHARLQTKWSTLIPWVSQLFWWLWGLVCCLSRIWDFKHFWWDVLSGAIIGLAVGYATVAYVCRWFRDSDNHTYQEMQMETQQNGTYSATRRSVIEDQSI